MSAAFLRAIEGNATLMRRFGVTLSAGTRNNFVDENAEPLRNGLDDGYGQTSRIHACR